MNAWDGPNRRKFPRVNYPCLITVRYGTSEPDVILTHTENIGTGGICVILNRNLRILSPVDLEIDLLDASNHVKSGGRIVWSIQRKSTEKKKPSFYDIGIEFTGMEDPDRRRLDDVVKRLVKQGHSSPYV